jgi:LAS superfamily LD-carboxypeptidase LdcB
MQDVDSSPSEQPLRDEASAPSAVPGAVSTDVPAATPPAAAATPAPTHRIELSHPFVKLALLAGMVLGLGVVASLQAPPALATSAPASSASAAPSSLVAASSPAPSPETEVVPHDVDDDEQPVRPKSGSKKRATSHAPDAKAGPTTGYRDGEPVRMNLTIIDGKPVEEKTAAQFRKMRAAAQRDGITLLVVSGFRTMERQRELYADYRAGRGHLAALPGHSNHQSGHALDLAVSAPKVRAWLESHAGTFGFRRTVPSEPWHWENLVSWWAFVRVSSRPD